MKGERSGETVRVGYREWREWCATTSTSRPDRSTDRAGPVSGGMFYMGWICPGCRTGEVEVVAHISSPVRPG